MLKNCFGDRPGEFDCLQYFIPDLSMSLYDPGFQITYLARFSKNFGWYIHFPDVMQKASHTNPFNLILREAHLPSNCTCKLSHATLVTRCIRVPPLRHLC